MSRRLAILLAAAVLVVVGAAAAWAATRGGDGTAKGDCTQSLVTVADPGSGKMMTYRPRAGDCSVPGDARP